MLKLLRNLVGSCSLRVYWFGVFFFIAAASLGAFNTPSFIPSVLAGFVACGVALHYTQYRWNSCASIFVLGHVVQYPLAAVIVMTLSAPELALEPVLWDTTPQAMWCLVLAMAGASIGFVLGRINIFGSEPNVSLTNFAPWITSRGVNLGISSLSVVTAILYIYLGIYYHTSIANYDIGNSQIYGFLGYLYYAALAGPILQLRRYIITKRRSDLIFAGICFATVFLSFAPSGARRATILTLVAGFLYFMDKEKRASSRGVMLVCGLVVLATLLPLLEEYRSMNVVGADSIFSRFAKMLESILTFSWGSDRGQDQEVFWMVLGRRLSDYISVGYLIDELPNKFDFVGYGDIWEWPLYFFPTLLRPATTLSFNYDALYMDKYMFRPVELTGGSSPMMFVGDLYNRGGYISVFIGMVVTGFILKKLDDFVLKDEFRTTVIWVLMIDTLTSLHAMTLLKFFTLMTRQLLIFYIISRVLEALVRRRIANSENVLNKLVLHNLEAHPRISHR